MKVFATFLIACLVLGALLRRRPATQQYAAIVVLVLLASFAFYGLRML